MHGSHKQHGKLLPSNPHSNTNTSMKKSQLTQSKIIPTVDVMSKSLPDENRNVVVAPTPIPSKNRVYPPSEQKSSVEEALLGKVAHLEEELREVRRLADVREQELINQMHEELARSENFYQTKVKAVQKEGEDYLEELTKSRGKILQIEGQLKAQTEEIARLEGIKRDFEGELKSFKSRISENDVLIRRLQEENEQLRAMAKSIEMNTAEEQKKTDTKLKETIEHQRKDIEKLSGELSEMVTLKAAFEAKVKDLLNSQKEIRMKDRQLLDTEEKINSLIAEIDRLNSSLSQSDARLEEVLKELSTAKKESMEKGSNAEIVTMQLNEAFHSKEKEIVNLKQFYEGAITTLRNENSALEDKFKVQLKELERMSSVIGQKDRDIVSIKKSHEQEVKDIHEDYKKIINRELTRLSSEYEGQIEVLNEKLEKVKELETSVEIETREKDAQVQSLEQKYEDSMLGLMLISIESERLGMIFVERLQDIDLLNEKIDSLAVEIRTKDHEYKELQNKMKEQEAQFQEDMDNFIIENENFRKLATNSQQMELKYVNEKENYENEIAELQTKLQELEEKAPQVDNLKSKLAQAEREIHELRNNIGQLNSRNSIQLDEIRRRQEMVRPRELFLSSHVFLL